MVTTRKPARKPRLAPGEVAGPPPLAEAAIAGNWKATTRLLSAGTDANAWWKKRHRGQAIGRCDVLEAAVAAGQARTALLLVEAGVPLSPFSRRSNAHPAISSAWRQYCELGDAAHPDQLDDVGKATLISLRTRAPKPGVLAEWNRLVLAMLDRGALPSGSALVHAACWRDHDLLNRLLAAGVEKDSLVREAIRRGWCDILDLLVQHGASFAPPAVSDAAAKLGFGARVEDFPLFHAIEAGQAKVVAAVLRAKPDLTALSSTGVHALLYACMHDREDLVRLLLEAGADPDQPGTFHHLHLRLPCEPGDPLRIDVMREWARIAGTTALIVAVRRGQVKVVTALLKGRANANRQDAQGISPLAWAAKLGHQEIASLLRSANAKDDDGHGNPAHALIAAAKRGDLAEVRRLASRRSLVETCEEQELRQITPLAAAASSGHVAVVRALLALGADPMRKLLHQDWLEFTPLLMAAAGGHDVCFMAMVEAGADPHATCGGENALHLAARHGRVQVITTMVKTVRVPVDMLTLEGRSALALAAEHRHPDAVEALLALGANPNLRQKNGPIIQTALFNWPDVGEQTPESMEASRRCVRLLIAAGADVRYRPRKHDWPCLSPAVQHDLELTRMLLEAGADYDASSALGFPLLHACQEGRVDTAKALLEQGATVNQRTADGWSAVLWAAVHGPDFTRMLLDAGADPRSMTDDGFNLVWAACRSAQDDEADTMVDALVRGAERAGARVEVIAAGQQEDTALATLRLVIDAGADPLARMDGKTPLQDKSIPEALRSVIAKASGKSFTAKRTRR